MKPAALLLMLLVLTGCARSDSPSPPVSTPTEESNRTEVAWDDYGAMLQDRIDELETAKNCAELQKEFDNADANSELTATRTDHNNSALMRYIDEALKLADCYG